MPWFPTPRVPLRAGLMVLAVAAVLAACERKDPPERGELPAIWLDAQLLSSPGAPVVTGYPLTLPAEGPATFTLTTTLCPLETYDLTAQDRSDYDGRRLYGLIQPETRITAEQVPVGVRVRIDPTVLPEARFDSAPREEVPHCHEVRADIEVDAGVGSHEFVLRASWSNGGESIATLDAPVPVTRPGDDGGAPPPVAACGPAPDARSRWVALGDPFVPERAGNGMGNAALTWWRDGPAIAFAEGPNLDGLRVQRWVGQRWRQVGISPLTPSGPAAARQFVGLSSGAPLAPDELWLSHVAYPSNGGDVSLRLMRETNDAFQDIGEPLPLPSVRIVQVRRAQGGVYAAVLDGAARTPTLWRLDPAAPAPAWAAVALSDDLPKTAYALALDVDDRGRLLLALDRQRADGAQLVTDIEVWRYTPELGWRQPWPAVEASRGPQDVGGVFDLTLNAADPAAGGRELVLAWTTAGATPTPAIHGFDPARRAWAALGDWAAGVTETPQPYGFSTLGRSMVVHCSGAPVMAWTEFGATYPGTLSWVSVLRGITDARPSGWEAVSGAPLPPAGVPSPGQVRLVNRPGGLPVAVVSHGGGYGDTPRVDVVEAVR